MAAAGFKLIRTDLHFVLGGILKINCNLEEQGGVCAPKCCWARLGKNLESPGFQRGLGLVLAQCDRAAAPPAHPARSNRGARSHGTGLHSVLRQVA